MGCGKSKHDVVTATTVIKSMRSDGGKEIHTTKTVTDKGDSSLIQQVETKSLVVEDSKKETVTTKIEPPADNKVVEPRSVVPTLVDNDITATKVAETPTSVDNDIAATKVTEAPTSVDDVEATKVVEAEKIKDSNPKDTTEAKKGDVASKDIVGVTEVVKENDQKNKSYQKDDQKEESSLKDDQKNESSLKDDQKKESSLKDDQKKESSLKDDQKKESSLKDDLKKESSLKDDQKKESSLKDDQKDDQKKESSLKDDQKKESNLKDDQKKESNLKDDQEANVAPTKDEKIKEFDEEAKTEVAVEAKAMEVVENAKVTDSKEQEAKGEIAEEKHVKTVDDYSNPKENDLRSEEKKDVAPAEESTKVETKKEDVKAIGADIVNTETSLAAEPEKALNAKEETVAETKEKEP